MRVQPLKKYSKQDFDDLSSLYQEFDQERPPLLETNVKNLLKSKSAILFVLRDQGRIIGMFSIGYTPIVSKLRVHFDLLVVSKAYRGKGLGKLLAQAAIDHARKHGAHEIRFSSRPSSEVANVFFKKFGFEKYETNVYRLKL
jgi:ribosomal protein S18 acetylase RimI-like enzyme